MPKSSSAISMPAAWKRESWSMTSAFCSISEPSVISMTRLPTGTFLRSIMLDQDSGPLAGAQNSTGDLLTEIWKPLPSTTCQRASWSSASVSTQRPMSMMRPDSSATAMKSAGWIGPRTGWSQRIRASALQTLPVRRLTMGW
ncbi:hypothetical protein D9M72_345900 [compost metagenome]